jgi:hypothetical protein
MPGDVGVRASGIELLEREPRYHVWLHIDGTGICEGDSQRWG